ncbi:MAG: 1-acyl-sn-glycerol-3-phosphate acyltransferase [Spirochaetes bacterium]|nr:1-acyl-sn-glycerol-3-phosphate acyltransferase [Spirochaetota bacterium]
MRDRHEMNRRFQNCSTAIKNGRIHRRSNYFFEFFIRILFRKIDFDAVSLAMLKELDAKSNIVFASFHTSATSLLIFTSLLKRHGFNVPVLAIGIRPYAYQMFLNVVRFIFRSLRRFIIGKKFQPVADFDCIKSIVKDRKGLIVSVLSKKLFLLRYFEKRRDPFQDLVEIQKSADEPIFLVPQLIFWNMNPEKTKTFLASRATGDRGLFSALFATHKSITPPSVRIASPLNLKEFIDQHPIDSSRLLAQRVRQKLFEIYNLEKRSALGPVIKTYQELMESVLYHPALIDAIKRISLKEGKSEIVLRKKAYKYYRTIAADFSIVVVKYFQKFMMRVFYKVFRDIKYNPEDFRKLREASHRGTLIIVPCHRSHMDYLIISSMFYENRIIPPHILAGDNMSFFPLGILFRKSGAFFISRSMRGKELYEEVFKQYLKMLVREGYAIEFFIEGGRTRTGKIMKPKFGMLKYLVEAIEEGCADDLMFIPVAINYDRVLEEKSFQRELRGEQKKRESNMDVIHSKKYLKGGYGNVYLKFGEAISCRELKSQVGADELVRYIGETMVKRISEGVVVTSFALVSSAMLVSAVKGFSVQDLKKCALSFLEYLNFLKVPLADALLERNGMDDEIDRIIETFERDGIVSRIKMEGDNAFLDEFYALNEEQRPRINFYKNTIVHYFLPVSLYSIAIIASANTSSSAHVKKIEEEFGVLVSLFSNEFVYPTIMDDVGKAAEHVRLYFESQGMVTCEDGLLCINDGGKDGLRDFGGLVVDVLEAYFIVARSFDDEKMRKINKNEFEQRLRRNGLRYYHLGEICHFESLIVPYYQTAVLALKSKNIVRERYKDDGTTEFVVEEREKLIAHIDYIKRILHAIEEWNRGRYLRILISKETKDEVARGLVH